MTTTAGHPDGAATSRLRRFPHRYHLHRAGIRNVWQYDDQEFLFGDGRLLLRGKNGAGKSKALEMLLPFLLDGDARAIDATGGNRTTLKWLMLDGTDVVNRLGYLWLELRRVDAEGDEWFRTLGVALRASRSSGEVRPLFFITPHRVGYDLTLVDGGQPLGLDRLREAVGEDAVYPVARDYRERVAKDIFGLSDPGRYRNLTHLLHRLRRPTIGDRIESGGLAHVLAEALPPLDDEVVDTVARNLDDLDAVRADLARLEATDAAVTTFLASYRGYLHGVLRRRVESVRDELRELRERRRAAGAAERLVAELTSREGELAAVLDALTRQRDDADTDLRALVGSAEYKSLEELRGLRRTVDALRVAADAAAGTALSRQDATRSAGGRLDDDTGRIVDAAAAVRSGQAELAKRARAAGLDPAHAGEPPRPAVTTLASGIQDGNTHDGAIRTVDVDGLRDASDAFAAQLADADTVARARQRDARALDGLLAAADVARDHAVRAEEAVVGAEERARAAVAAADARAEAVAAASAGYAADVQRWCDDPRLPAAADVAWVRAVVELPAGDAVPAADRSLEREVPGAVERAAHDVLDPLVAALDGERDAAARDLRAIRDELAALRAEYAEVERLRDPSPLRRAYTAAVRDPAQGTPFYLLIDFADNLDALARAGVEAALEASGLLDGWLTADGRLVDPTTQDILLRPEPPPAGPRLDEVLRPIDGSRPVGEGTVAALLASVGFGESDASSWVDASGRWRLGVTAGAWAKPEAEYVGAAVRAATRARRLARLADRIRAREQDEAAADELLRAATSRRDGLRAVLREVPRGGGLADAWAQLAAASRAADQAGREVAAARADADRARAEAVAARRRAETTAHATSLPADAERLREVRAALDRFVDELRRVRGAIQDLPATLGAHAGRRAAYERAVAEATAAAEEATRADREHDSARRELAGKEATVGASEQELLAREGDARRRLEQAGTELPAAVRRHGAVHDDRVRAEEARDTALAARAGQERRTVAVGADLRRVLGLPTVRDAAGLTPPASADEDESDATDADAFEEEPSDVRGRIRRLDELTGEVAGMLAAATRDVSDTLILRRADELRDALPGGYDATVTETDGVKLVSVHDDAGPRPVASFGAQIAGAAVEARGRLSEREQEVFRRFLLGELGDSLSRQLVSAQRLVHDMNAVLAEVRSSHGIGVRLVWRLRDDSDADTRVAVELLATPSGLRTHDQSERLRVALQRLIEAERVKDPTAGYGPRLRTALDYRAWHDFDVRVTDVAGRERRLGPRTGLSQGEQRVISYLALFAAAAAHFSSLGEVSPHVPRLILLDDAFAKVDEPTHGRLLGLLVDLDLDFVLTSERLWGWFPEVPDLRIYECLRDPQVRGVATLHYVWNGQRMTLVT
jgi:uncharacterized protein (TIGR02680 family)